MFRRPTLDQQIERNKLKPPRHPFVTLGGFVILLFSAGAIWFVFHLVVNAVPVASLDVSIMPTAAPTARPLTPIALPAAVNLSPTVAALARPATWTVRMVSDTLDGRAVVVGVVDNPQVKKMVWNDFVEAYRWLYTTGWHSDYATEVYKYFADGTNDDPDTATMASGLRAFLDAEVQQGEFVQIQVQGGSLEKNYQVWNFAANGLKVHVHVTVEGKSQTWSFTQPSRLVNEVSIKPNTRIAYTMLYDAADKRWKIVNTKLLR